MSSQMFDPQAHYLVTGGAGFIGCNVVEALNRRGAEHITIVDHLASNPDLKRRNLQRLRFSEYLDRADFRERLRAGTLAPVKGIVHLGACSSTTETDEAYLRDNNLGYTRELCEWALRIGARFVYASSAATYGDGSLGYSDAEALSTRLHPLNLYGLSKLWFDQWALEQGLFGQIVGVKYFNVYGPWEDHKGDMRSVVNKAYAQLQRDGEITLFRSYRHEYRDGEQERDFIHVDDAVAVTLFLLEMPEVNGLYNCGTGVARTWLDLARSLFAAVGREPNIRFVDMPASLRDKYQYHTQAPMEKLRAAGYSAPFLTIEEGVRRYVREYLGRE